MFQNRASDDYKAGNSQWKIGVNAAWMWPLGQTPFKDAFWTSKKPCPRFIYMVESRPELESVVVALAAGPTGWGDLIEQTNRSLLMRCCNEEGLILKPSKPASAVDDVFQHVIMWIDVHFLLFAWWKHLNWMFLKASSLNKMAAIFQTIFSDAFSWMKSFVHVFWL